ncbi:ribonuclease HII [Kocuria coralli]|nr:ribonuclease HII [Kocuria coralli]
MKPAPTLELEHELFSGGITRIAGMDEVGRGALAGPVTVGVAVVDRAVGVVPVTLRDSKLLRPSERVTLVPEVESWALEVRTGTASPAEIDAFGIVAALRLAGSRALAALPRELRPDLVLLDGVHDWLTPPPAGLFPDDAAAGTADAGSLPSSVADEDAEEVLAPWDGPVRTVVKGDLRCASIAAASVVAKVDRDALMTGLHDRHPAYGWAGNKGYGSAAHRAAILERGATDLHRRSWNLGLAGR